ncbi:hypothetical protein GCM10027067_39320 [Pseudactinotalea suaedae]
MLAGILLVAWISWPVLGYGALITAAPFFGELPTRQQQEAASRLALAAVGVGLLGPVVGFALAGRGSRLRVLALVEAVVTLVVAALVLGLGLL